MALGGGTYTVQNKILPGAYFQFISTPAATAELSERGVAAIALDLNWGVEDSIFTVDAGDFQKNSLKIFGYAYSADELKGLRDLFLNASSVHFYRLNGGGVKASNDFATAKYAGTRGNSLKIVIAANVDDETQFDVSTYLDTTRVDTQTVESAADLVANDFVTFKATAELVVNAGAVLTAGTNSTSDASKHQAFLNKLESYPDTNAVGFMGTEDAIKGLYTAFAKRLRDEVGIKLQAVVYNKKADNIATVNVKNKVTDTVANEASLIYWALGVIAGTGVNESATNKTYDGEYTINTDYTQKELEAAIKAGEWTLHQVGEEVHVLEDINSFVSITDDEGEVFQDNQTVRIIDSIATSIASVFATKFIGKVPNDQSGRVSLWSDIVKVMQELNDIRALEGFDPADITVEQGDSKKSVVVNSAVTVINTMTKLYMKTVIS